MQKNGGGEGEGTHEICPESKLAEMSSQQTGKSPISKKALLIALKVLETSTRTSCLAFLGKSLYLMSENKKFLQENKNCKLYANISINFPCKMIKNLKCLTFMKWKKTWQATIILKVISWIQTTLFHTNSLGCLFYNDCEYSTAHNSLDCASLSPMYHPTSWWKKSATKSQRWLLV